MFDRENAAVLQKFKEMGDKDLAEAARESYVALSVVASDSPTLQRVRLLLGELVTRFERRIAPHDAPVPAAGAEGVLAMLDRVQRGFREEEPFGLKQEHVRSLHRIEDMLYLMLQLQLGRRIEELSTRIRTM